jgi:hypothetical protein
MATTMAGATRYRPPPATRPRDQAGSGRLGGRLDRAGTIRGLVHRVECWAWGGTVADR